MADREGFEPSEAFTSPHFECGALDHYATYPREIMTQNGSIRIGTHRGRHLFLDFLDCKRPIEALTVPNIQGILGWTIH